ncbi:MAG TPA: hypothetical protein VFF04_05785 [Candidatus Babeliales bacterium]|nr:hypothetical protein [Candidatus Babeliales bacterium]
MKKKIILLTLIVTSCSIFGQDDKKTTGQFDLNQFNGDLRKPFFVESSSVYKGLIKKIGKSCNAFAALSDADQDQILYYVTDSFLLMLADMKTISPKQSQIISLKCTYIMANIDGLMEQYVQLRQEKKLDTQFGEFFTQAVEKGVEKELGVSLASLGVISIEDRAKMDERLLAKLKAQ